MTWFRDLFGVEESAVDVRDAFAVDGPWLTAPNGRRFHHGTLTTPSLGELLDAVADLPPAGPSTLREVVGDAAALHLEPTNAGATFQVASQLNALEMPSPGVTPEAGITAYVHDHTQGPACAVACAAGTVVRNWFAPVAGQLGQTADRQLNGLADYAGSIGLDPEVRNGYALPTADELARFAATPPDPGLLRVAVHADTEVTLDDAGHRLTQVYASAMPIAYHDQPLDAWEPLARATLEAAYRSTLAVGALRATRTGNRTVFLTLLGGGVFGNPTSWILDAIATALDGAAGLGLDVAVVSFRQPNPALRGFVTN